MKLLIDLGLGVGYVFVYIWRMMKRKDRKIYPETP